jgi:hypothetical protein
MYRGGTEQLKINDEIGVLEKTLQSVIAALRDMKRNIGDDQAG